MISPELNAVQDRVQDSALNLTWFRGGGGDDIAPSPPPSPPLRGEGDNRVIFYVNLYVIQNPL
jgi:hypothetical protein